MWRLKLNILNGTVDKIYCIVLYSTRNFYKNNFHFLFSPEVESNNCTDAE